MAKGFELLIRFEDHFVSLKLEMIVGHGAWTGAQLPVGFLLGTVFLQFK